MQKIIPHLWFDKEAEEAVNFYTSIFGGGKVLGTTRYTEAGHEIHKMDAGTVMTVEFEIEGHRFVALNGGPIFKFNPSISFTVSCPTKEELDTLWEKLSEGGTALMPLDKYPFSERYGWIQDKYGLSWQVILATQPVDQKIAPALMFAGEQCGKAEEAIKFYASVFENSEVKAEDIFRYGSDQPPDKEGTVAHAGFTLEGQKFSAMDSARNHDFVFNEAISLMVTCKDQEEIDRLWEKLSAVPASEQCGWLKDKYGVSWQIVPGGMEKMLNDPDKEKVKRAMNSFLQMKKIDIAELNRAIEGK